MKKIEIKDLMDRLEDKLPKRILSLDGGGTKGIVTIAMLEKLESKLKALVPDEEKEDFRLNQYFDYIGGTSTGSIIAVLLSIGYRVKDVKDLYFEFGKKVFGWKAKIIRPKSYFGFLHRYKAKYIEEILLDTLKERQLSDNNIKNLLAIFTKNTKTNNIWTFNNNPKSHYFGASDSGGKRFPNGDQLLRDLVRASTAAPIYFDPKELKTTTDKSAMFVDGGVSMENNPAFRLFLMAKVPYYNLDWSVGDKNILLVSLGTGLFTHHYIDSVPKIVKTLPGMYMQNASQTTEIIMRALSQHKNDIRIDRELKDVNPIDFGNRASLTYLRYNVKYRGLPSYKKDWEEMDSHKSMKDLYAYAKSIFKICDDDIQEGFLSHYYDWKDREKGAAQIIETDQKKESVS